MPSVLQFEKEGIVHEYIGNYQIKDQELSQEQMNGMMQCMW